MPKQEIELSEEDLRKLTAFFSLLIEIDQRNKKKKAQLITQEENILEVEDHLNI